MRVLIVEDEPTLAESVALALSKANMIPTMVSNGVHAIEMLRQARVGSRTYAAVVLDLTLPGMDGMDVLKKMRDAGDMTPVCVLTARVTLADRLGGLEGGADDYLSKPFETDELLARLRAISRRRVEPAPTQKAVGNLVYDVAKGAFFIDGAVLILPARQHLILTSLFKHLNDYVTRDSLMNIDQDGASTEAVDNQLSRLRKRLRNDGAEVAIRTIYGVGYKLEPADCESTAVLVD